MTSEQVVEIPLSKESFVWLLVGAAAFVSLGIWFWFVGDADAVPMDFSPVVWRIVGSLFIGVFGLVGLYALLRIVDNRPGLVIGTDGIIDHSRAFSVGKLDWSEIESFDITPLKSQQIVTVNVDDPDRFTRRGNWLQRWRARLNHRLYDTPVQLSAHTLQIEFDELVELLEQRFRRHRTSDDTDWEIPDVSPRADASVE